MRTKNFFNNVSGKITLAVPLKPDPNNCELPSNEIDESRVPIKYKQCTGVLCRDDGEMQYALMLISSLKTHTSMAVIKDKETEEPIFIPIKVIEVKNQVPYASPKVGIKIEQCTIANPHLEQKEISSGSNPNAKQTT